MPNTFGPPAFDEAQYCNDFIVCEDVFAGRHVRFVIIISNDLSEAVLGQLEQHLISVVQVCNEASCGGAGIFMSSPGERQFGWPSNFAPDG